MIVWGGSAQGWTNTGGQYDLAMDSWTPTSTSGAPSARVDHTAVWTGTRMIVWGGCCYLATGASYDSVSNTWSPIAVAGAPTGRMAHLAVWSGNEMIVWGGQTGYPEDPPQPTLTDTGGRYDPAANAWIPTSMANAPNARYRHAGIWTGDELVVWGGECYGTTCYFSGTDTGGRYSPHSDSWSATSVEGAPIGRSLHTAVWTGEMMIVWGGGWSSGSSGGRYRAANTADDDGDGYAPCSGDCDDGETNVHPGAVETCDLRDDDCDGTIDEGFDADADGHTSCGGDCDDGNPEAWGTPGEVHDLVFGPGHVTLRWNSPLQPGGVLRYDTLRSSSAANFVTAVICIESDDGADLIASDPAVPAIGEVFHYLTRAQNECALGQGPLGHSSNGTPTLGRVCP
jgi:hypothetical protein